MLDKLKADIAKYKEEITAYIAKDVSEINSFKEKYLGPNGVLKQLFGYVKDIEDKKSTTALLTEFKDFAEDKHETLKTNI